MLNAVRYLCLSVILLLLLGDAKADCQLSQHELTQTNWVYADSSHQLLRREVVPDRATVYSVCSASSVQLSTCSGNSFSPALKTSSCMEPLKPVVEPIVDSCCKNVDGFTMFRVGYNAGIFGFLEIYRSCYQEKEVRANFTIYTAETSSSAVDRREHFTMDRIITGAAASSFQNPKIYQRYNQLFGPQDYFISGATVYDRGHLTPSLDFAFAQSRAQTNKYINVIPQFSRINRGNWKTIENWVRRKISSDPKVDALKVCTGVLGVLELYDGTVFKPVYLLHPNKNPVPKWIYKIVSHISGKKYVFVTYNNAHATAPPSPQEVSTICMEVGCQQWGLYVRQEGTAGYTYCCDPIHFITRTVSHLKGVF